jgi:hypothetical protein
VPDRPRGGVEPRPSPACRRARAPRGAAQAPPLAGGVAPWPSARLMPIKELPAPLGVSHLTVRNCLSMGTMGTRSTVSEEGFFQEQEGLVFSVPVRDTNRHARAALLLCSGEITPVWEAEQTSVDPWWSARRGGDGRTVSSRTYCARRTPLIMIRYVGTLVIALPTVASWSCPGLVDGEGLSVRSWTGTG